MRAHITITDDDGATYAGVCDLKLTGSLVQQTPPPVKTASTTLAATGELNFALPLRPFMKRFGANLGGHQKFALFIAYLAQGAVGEPVALRAVVDKWNKMTGMLGNFNLSYTIRAKDRGWLESPKSGTYALLPDWKELFT